MRKLQARSKKILKLLVILLMIFTCTIGNMQTINATSYTGPFTRVKELDYPKWWAQKLGVKQWSTWMCTFNGQWSYCLESSKTSPGAGEKTAQELIDSNEMVSKLLYYGYGGPAALPGNLDGTGTGLSDDGLSVGETHYLYTHVLLSIAYSGDMMGVDLDGLESLGIGLKGLYNYIASLPAPIAPHLSDNLTASFDVDNRNQKTNTVTFVASENATINVTLQDGVTLHNVTTGTSGTGVVAVNGGQSFYLTAPMSLSGDYTSGNIAGNNCNRFVPLAIYGSGNTQTHGSYAYDSAIVNYTVKWLDTGNLELSKTNTNQDLIDGAVFELKSTSYDGYLENITVKEGKIVINNLPLGTYELKEISAPEGYLLNSEIFKVTINANETTSQSISDQEPLGRIELTKEIDSSKTDGQTGEAFLSGNVYGLYAKEKITNQAKTITYYNQDELIDKQTTDNEGKIVFDNLHLGNYYLKEIQSNDSLVLNNQTIDVALTYEDQTVSKVIKTTKSSDRVNMQKIQVHKSGEKDGISGFVKGLQGCEFTFKLKSEVDHVGWDNALTYDVITSDEDGKATTKYLPYGTYLVKETKTPKDYLTAPDFTITISDDYSEYKDIEQIKTIDINNRPMTTQLKLIKRDQETNEIVSLNSAVFQIKAKEDIVVNGQVIYQAGEPVVQKVSGKNYDTFTTNSDNLIISSGYVNPDNSPGTVILPLQLDPGKYYLEEVKTPAGFLSLTAPIEFTVENIRDYNQDDDGDYLLEINVVNSRPKAMLEIFKSIVSKESDTNLTDIDDLSAIKFKLTAKEEIISPIDGSVIYGKGATIGEYNLSKDGYLKISDLPMGVGETKYQLQEIETLPGLVLDNQKYDVVFTQDDDTTKEYSLKLELENRPTDLQFYKTDVAGNEVAGAKLQIIDLDGQVIDQWISTNEPHTIQGLTAGQTYILHEELSPLGYNLSRDIEFTVKNTTDSQNITMVDTVTKVIKVDEDGNLLEGAKLQIIDQSTGEIVDSWTSRQHLFDMTPELQQKLQNQETVSGQLSDEALTSYTIYPDEDNFILKLETKETTSYHYIDINGNETYHLAWNLETDKTYLCKEIAAPLGYATAQSQEFKVTDQDVVLTIENQITKVEISKIDLTNQQELPGASLLVKDSQGNIVDEWVSTTSPHLIKGLHVGQEYTLVETAAPKGYALAEMVKFTIEDTGEIQKVVMFDNLLAVKTGDQSDLRMLLVLMAGSGLMIMIGGLYMYRRRQKKIS